MAHDWGHVFRQAAAGIFGGMPTQTPPTNTYFAEDPATPNGGSMGGGGATGDFTQTAAAAACGLPCDGMIAACAPPKGYKIVNSCGVGVLRKVRRRRRRRLLTASDKADISYIVATTGKGQLAASLIHRSAQ